MQSGRSECGREFVRRACFRRVPACSPAPPPFEWRAGRLPLCPGDGRLKGTRSGGVPGSQARGPEAASSLEYPSGVGRPTSAKLPAYGDPTKTFGRPSEVLCGEDSLKLSTFLT